MDIQKYIDEIKNSEVEEPMRGVETDTVIRILEKLQKEFNLTAVDTRPRPRHSRYDRVDTERTLDRVFLDDFEFHPTPADASIGYNSSSPRSSRGQLWHAIDASLTLSEEGRRTALEYVENNYPHSDICVGDAFRWSETPQGEDFWIGIHRVTHREFESPAAKTIMHLEIPTALKRVALYAFNKLRTASDRGSYWVNEDVDDWSNVISWTYLPDRVGVNINRYIAGESGISTYFKSFWNEPALIKLTPSDLWKVACEVMGRHEENRNWRTVYPWIGSENGLLYAIIIDDPQPF